MGVCQTKVLVEKKKKEPVINKTCTICCDTFQIQRRLCMFCGICCLRNDKCCLYDHPERDIHNLPIKVQNNTQFIIAMMTSANDHNLNTIPESKKWMLNWL